MGQSYISLGDYKSAVSFLERSIKVKNELNAKLGLETIFNYINLGTAYKALKEYVTAIEKYKEALYLAEKLYKNNPNLISDIKGYIIRACLEKGDIQDAETNYKNLTEYYKRSENVDSFSVYKALTIYSIILSEKKNFDKSIRNTLECIRYFDSINEVEWMLYSYDLLITAYSEKGSYKEGASVYEKLKLSFLDENNELDIEKIAQYDNGYGTYLSILLKTGQMYLALFKQNEMPEYLLKGKEVYENLIDLFAKSYRRILLESSKISRTSEIKEHLKQAVELAVLHYTNNPTDENFSFALKVAEFGKSLVLLEKLDENSAMKLSGIPAEYVKELSSLRKQIVHTSFLLSKDKSTPLSQEEKEDLEAALYDKKLEISRIEKQLEEKYPLYKELSEFKINTSVIDIAENLIDADQTAIEYYMQDDKLYTFIISKDIKKILVKDLPQDFENEIEEFISLITSSGDPEDFAATAFKIYKIVFNEADSLINTERVLIINDGIIGYIPFDALLYEMPYNDINFKTLPYLIKKYSISYAYSFNILSKSSEGKEAITSFLGIAPFSAASD